MTGAAFPQGLNASLQVRQRDTGRGHGGREPQLGGPCGEGSRGRGFSTSHLIGKEFEEPVAQFPWDREGTGLFSAEAVGVQDKAPQPSPRLLCAVLHNTVTSQGSPNSL